MLNVKDRLILVVGSSSGIGRQTAITLSKYGARIVLMARREDRLNKVLEELYPGEHTVQRIDVRDPEIIAAAIENTVSACGKIDGLVYAAGISDDLPLRFLTVEKQLEVFYSNYFGFIEMIRQVSRKGRFQKGMRIVGVSSPSAVLGERAHTAYSASKAAMDAAVRCIAKELASKQIAVNTIAPGWTDTEMTRNFFMTNGMDSEIVSRMLKRQYMGLIEPESIANAICFLLSPESNYITGTTLTVDGGFSSSI